MKPVLKIGFQFGDVDRTRIDVALDAQTDRIGPDRQLGFDVQTVLLLGAADEQRRDSAREGL